MNKSAFLKLIKQVSDISDQQQSELEQVAGTFPYCQTAHLLLAKSAYDKGSMLSTQRLRRASAYATDRQLLKRLIYASPVLEPAYAEEAELTEAEVEETELAEATAALSLPGETQIDKGIAAPSVNEAVIPETIHDAANEPGIPAAASEEETAGQIVGQHAQDAVPETEPEQEAETLDQVYSHTSAENILDIEQEPEVSEDTENPEAEIDSELALLFTFSSIGTSSTDLISRRGVDSGMEELAEEETDSMHLAQTTEALHDLEEAPTELTAETADEDSTDGSIPEATPVQEATVLPEIENSDTHVSADTALDEEATGNITVPAGAALAAEDAAINYSLDEIDRLYAEDALGYWMGSSRMGEVLQLKDEYTRPRPQSFHPELILEYSRTHELEKAIQPTKHVLSKQLDIIDQFLKLNPRLKTMASLKLKPEPQEDLSLKSSKIKKGMASESLANIFIQQGKPKKAVKIYEQLILKYPEKKSYFAEQIEKLQNIT